MDESIKPEDLLNQIFKIQIPFNDKDGHALIYNKDRSLDFMHPAKKLKKFMNGQHKIFASFHFEKGDVYLKEEEWQDW